MRDLLVFSEEFRRDLTSFDVFDSPQGTPGSTQEAPRRLPRMHPEGPRAPQRLQEVLEAIIDTTLS